MDIDKLYMEFFRENIDELDSIFSGLTVRQLANLLGVSKEAILRYIRRGVIKGYKDEK